VSVFFVNFRLCPCSQTEALAVPHGLDTMFDGSRGRRLYRESYAPDCWLPFTQKVPFRLGHDTGAIGEVTVVAAHGRWHYGSALIDGHSDALNKFARERMKPGARISLGGRSVTWYEDPDLRIVRHTKVKLEEVALVRDGEIPGFIGAEITDVRELPQPKLAARVVDGITLQPGDELLDSERRIVFRNNDGTIEQRPYREPGFPSTARSRSASPPAVYRGRGQEIVIEGEFDDQAALLTAGMTRVR
jgi:hypothetical protein